MRHEALQLVTAPQEEPLTLAEGKAHLRFTINDEDALITGWLLAARRYIESYTGRALVTQTWDYFLDAFPCWALEVPKPPLRSIVSIKYFDDAGVEQTLAPAGYLVDIKSDPGRVTPAYGERWPVARAQMNAVTLRLEAGYGLAADVLEELKSAQKLLLTHFFENRGHTSLVDLKEVPLGVRALLDPLRVTRFD